MHLIKETIPFEDTHFFSPMAVDYVGKDSKVSIFINEFPSLAGIETQIERRRKSFSQPAYKAAHRNLLHQVLLQQYHLTEMHPEVKKHIDLLCSEKTFTICTAHQPCIFTGPLYFIYKIAQTIALAKACSDRYTDYHFVPVFYMGSEDNDLDEIGTVHIDRQLLKWTTAQRGACGRMGTDDLQLLTQQVLSMLDLNREEEAWLSHLLERAYMKGHTLSDAIRILVNGLFENHGLVILNADDQQLKSVFAPLIEDELFNRNSSALVQQSNAEIASHYKVQAGGRDINLFYLNDQLRERIEKKGERWVVHDTAISFSAAELQAEVRQHPERFSPNVILRPVYQEMLLPNVAFIGGGGELAYWLELKKVFEHYDIPYPLIFLRNSFLWIDQKAQALIKKLNLTNKELFSPAEQLYQTFLSENEQMLKLDKQLHQLENDYLEIEKLSLEISPNLNTSVKAHHAKARRISARIEQKFRAHLKRAESDKVSTADKIKEILFPDGTLQERHDHFLPYFKKYGRQFIEALIQYQSVADSEFIILKEKDI